MEKKNRFYGKEDRSVIQEFALNFSRTICIRASDAVENGEIVQVKQQLLPVCVQCPCSWCTTSECSTCEKQIVNKVGCWLLELPQPFVVIVFSDSLRPLAEMRETLLRLKAEKQSDVHVTQPFEGLMGAEERSNVVRRCIARYEKGLSTIVPTSRAGDVGINIPPVSLIVILNTNGESLAQWIQRVGRASRPNVYNGVKKTESRVVAVYPVKEGGEVKPWFSTQHEDYHSNMERARLHEAVPVFETTQRLDVL